MRLRQEVADLKATVDMLKERSVTRDQLYTATHIGFPRVVDSVYIGDDDYSIGKAIQLILNYLNFKIETTPERIELVPKEEK